MSPLETLRAKVAWLYEHPGRAKDWFLRWAYENHVKWTADRAEAMARKYAANVDFVVAGALLHDIADVEILRTDPNHDARSYALAAELLRDSGFSEEETKTIVEEIIKPHPNRNLKPTTIEGKIMASADGMAHLMTDFFLYFLWSRGENVVRAHTELGEFKDWVGEKIERDWNRIYFDDERAEAKSSYEAYATLMRASRNSG